MTEKLDAQTRESTDNAFAVGSNPVKNGVGQKVFEAISMGIHTRKRFSRSGIWRRMAISSSCTRYEAKKAEKSKTTTHL